MSGRPRQEQREGASFVTSALRELGVKARSELRSRLFQKLPFALTETARLGTLDPFVARALALQSTASGHHLLLLAHGPMGGPEWPERASALAWQLLARNHRVTFVFGGGKHDRREALRAPAHENLTYLPLGEFSARRFAMERGKRERIAALAFAPLPEYAPIMRYLSDAGATTLYDCSELWSFHPGKSGASAHAERRLWAEAHWVTATTRALAAVISLRAGREPALLPNGFDGALFKPAAPVRGKRRNAAPRARFPEVLSTESAGQIAICPVKSKPGHQLDWGVLESFARMRPEWKLIATERPPSSKARLPNNLLFADLPRASAPALFESAALALFPYRADGGEAARLPPELFEALSMGLPVGSTGLAPGRPPAQWPIVNARSRDELAETAGTLPSARAKGKWLERFRRQESWEARCARLEELLVL